jgi:hypothetical protein
MTHILLTGAGFSRNLGGWLASEVFNHLMSGGLDNVTRELLIKHSTTGRFENTLSEFQLRQTQNPNVETEQRLQALTSALYGMFEQMSQVFLRGQFEFQNDVAYMVRPFLNRFDAIFTVNQDTLLEAQYFDGNLPRWSGVQLPGINTKSFYPRPTCGVTAGWSRPFSCLI